MSRWVLDGLRMGVRTTGYPATAEHAPGVSPGRPVGGDELTPEAAAELAARCPSGALTRRDGEIVVDYRRCVHSYRCARQVATPLAWSDGYEWAGAPPGAPAAAPPLPRAFSRSLNVLVVDAGDCGACLHEVRQLVSPQYNLHRLGFFLTPTPRHADVLLVVGAGTDQMRVALEKAYDGMPTPRVVVAVGACALSGGVFGPSFVSAAGIGSMVPVDVEVPGEPPPPLAILHGLLVAAGRAAPVPLQSPADARPVAPGAGVSRP